MVSANHISRPGRSTPPADSRRYGGGIRHPYEALLRDAERHGGEPFSVFVSRAVDGLNQALAHPGPVLVVAHGGIFCAVQARVRVDYDGDMTNGVPVRLDPIDGEEAAWRMKAV
jgi:broad specificity phosphatase PhoE